MGTCIDHGLKGHPKGYAFTTQGVGTNTSLHRLAYCFANGITLEHIKGYSVRHSCDNTRCINPRHLSIGTHNENMQDMHDRGRAPKGLTNGKTKLTKEQADYIRNNYTPYCPINGATALAKKYGLHNSHVCRIAKGGRTTFVD